MNLTDAEIGSLVTVVVLLATALASYLNHRSTVRKIEELHAKVDAVSEAVGAPVDTAPAKRF